MLQQPYFQIPQSCRPRNAHAGPTFRVRKIRTRTETAKRHRFRICEPHADHTYAPCRDESKPGPWHFRRSFNVVGGCCINIHHQHH